MKKRMWIKVLSFIQVSSTQRDLSEEGGVLKICIKKEGNLRRSSTLNSCESLRWKELVGTTNSAPDS